MNTDDHNELNRLLGVGLHPSIVLDEMIQRWNRRWQMDGETARCRHCYVPQWPSSAEQPVKHQAQCPTSPYEYPWRDLAELLRTLPMGPLV